MEGNYKKWINRINSKQDVLTEDNVGEFMDLELSTKSAPTSGDTVLGRDSLTGKAVEIPTSSLGGNGNIDTSNLVPYTGANKDVNIGAYYFETSQGFKKTGGTANQALTANGDTFDLTTKLDKGIYTGNAQDLKTEIDGKLNKPTLISDGNVPRWNSSVENFVAGAITNTSDGKIGVSKANPTEALDVNGNVKSDSYKFTLPTALTPTPNTLIPKTDGSGLLWYNNSSTPADLGFKTKVISINSDTVLSEVHNNNIILITAKCTITIPSGLSKDFNCVFMVKGAFTATFIQGSGATIYAPNGLLLKTDSKASFFYESSNNYILTGELTTS